MNRSQLKKGFTLVELSIVMSLVAIMSATVASFCLMVDKRVKENMASYEYYDDMSSAQTMVFSWVDYFASEHAEFTAKKVTEEDETYGVLVASIDVEGVGVDYRVYLDKETQLLILEYPPLPSDEDEEQGEEQGEGPEEETPEEPTVRRMIYSYNGIDALAFTVATKKVEMQGAEQNLPIDKVFISCSVTYENSDKVFTFCRTAYL